MHARNERNAGIEIVVASGEVNAGPHRGKGRAVSHRTCFG
jgi:hypothetical protein